MISNVPIQPSIWYEYNDGNFALREQPGRDCRRTPHGGRSVVSRTVRQNRNDTKA